MPAASTGEVAWARGVWENVRDFVNRKAKHGQHGRPAGVCRMRSSGIGEAHPFAVGTGSPAETAPLGETGATEPGPDPTAV
jgi:hypothetical protein